jgi:hypothetical protein
MKDRTPSLACPLSRQDRTVGARLASVAAQIPHAVICIRLLLPCSSHIEEATPASCPHAALQTQPGLEIHPVATSRGASRRRPTVLSPSDTAFFCHKHTAQARRLVRQHLDMQGVGARWRDPSFRWPRVYGSIAVLGNPGKLDCRKSPLLRGQWQSDERGLGG